MKESRSRAWFFEHKNDIWRAANWVIDKPSFSGTPEEQIDFMIQDLAVRELLTGYTDAYDARNLDLTLTHFAEDAVMVLPGATLAGHQQIEAFFRQAMMGKISFHRIQNLVVRPGDEPGEAWLCAYFHAPSVWVNAGAGRSQFGRYFGRAVLEDGRWRFADLHISAEFVPTYIQGSAG